MLLSHLYLVAALSSALLILQAKAAPSSYQYVRFISRNKNNNDHITKQQVKTALTSRQTRSFDPYGLHLVSPLPEWDEQLYVPLSNAVSFERDGHITPDFSNGLDYPDPLLLTGLSAKRAVAILYRKEMFFDVYPHVRALLRHQDERRRNGLDGNRLGSLRPQLPFYRFKNSHQRDSSFLF